MPSVAERELRVEFELGVSDIVAFVRHLTFPAQRQAFLLAGLVAFLGVTAVVAYGRMDGLAWGHWLAIIGMLAYLAWTIYRALPQHVQRQVQAQLDAKQYDKVLGSWTLAISQEGVRIEAPFLKDEPAWSRITRVETDKNGVYLISDNEEGWVIPRRSVSGHMVPARAFANPVEAKTFFKQARKLLRKEMAAARHRTIAQNLTRTLAIWAVLVVVFILIYIFTRW